MNLFCKTPSPSEAANSRNWNDNNEMNLLLKSKERRLCVRIVVNLQVIKIGRKYSMGVEYRAKKKQKECCTGPLLIAECIF